MAGWSRDTSWPVRRWLSEAADAGRAVVARAARAVVAAVKRGLGVGVGVGVAESAGLWRREMFGGGGG